jgi:hypothetical protein
MDWLIVITTITQLVAHRYTMPSAEVLLKCFTCKEYSSRRRIHRSTAINHGQFIRAMCDHCEEDREQLIIKVFGTKMPM